MAVKLVERSKLLRLLMTCRKNYQFYLILTFQKRILIDYFCSALLRYLDLPQR